MSAASHPAVQASACQERGGYDCWASVNFVSSNLRLEVAWLKMNEFSARESDLLEPLP